MVVGAGGVESRRACDGGGPAGSLGRRIEFSRRSQRCPRVAPIGGICVCAWRAASGSRSTICSRPRLFNYSTTSPSVCQLTAKVRHAVSARESLVPPARWGRARRSISISRSEMATSGQVLESISKVPRSRAFGGGSSGAHPGKLDRRSRESSCWHARCSSIHVVPNGGSSVRTSGVPNHSRLFGVHLNRSGAIENRIRITVW